MATLKVFSFAFRVLISLDGVIHGWIYFYFAVGDLLDMSLWIGVFYQFYKVRSDYIFK